VIYTISKKDQKVTGEVNLTASKSESNRVLIIQALCNQPFSIRNLALAKDTQTLKEILDDFRISSNGVKTYDVGPAGTTMRFLTSYFSSIEGARVILTGSERMKQRPISILVNALSQIGAKIEYLEKEGYPPLMITGKKLEGSKIVIDGSVSSQYISSLLLVAPTLPAGLTITLEGEITSRPYIEMTIKIMRHFGAKLKWEGNAIRVDASSYLPEEFTIEADWSAASYWYAMAELADDTDLMINGLRENSLQGDSEIARIFEKLGVRTSYNEKGIHLTKIRKIPDSFSFNFKDCPDIAQTVAVVVAALKIPSTLAGLETLRIKETDRITALINEFKKIGVKAYFQSPDILKIIDFEDLENQIEPISTYEDHRMAMAFAALALKFEEISIENPTVVEKSYPGFWDDLRKLGFQIKTQD